MLNWGLFDLVEILHLLGFQNKLFMPKALLIYGRYRFLRAIEEISEYVLMTHGCNHIRNCSNHDLEPDYARSHISSSS